MKLLANFSGSDVERCSGSPSEQHFAESAGRWRRAREQSRGASVDVRLQVAGSFADRMRSLRAVTCHAGGEATLAPNHAMQRTADRSAFLLSVTSTFNQQPTRSRRGG